MPKLTIYDPRGKLEAEGEAAAGLSLLEASVLLGARHGSACGGVCSCSTCHVWVKRGVESLGDQEDAEMDILDRAFEVKPHSRVAGVEDTGLEVGPGARDHQHGRPDPIA